MSKMRSNTASAKGAMKRKHLWYVLVVLAVAVAMAIPVRHTANAAEEKKASAGRRIQPSPPKGMVWGMSIEKYKERFGKPHLEGVPEDPLSEYWWYPAEYRPSIYLLCHETKLMDEPCFQWAEFHDKRLVKTSRIFSFDRFRFYQPAYRDGRVLDFKWALEEVLETKYGKPTPIDDGRGFWDTLFSGFPKYTMSFWNKPRDQKVHYEFASATAIWLGDTTVIELGTPKLPAFAGWRIVLSYSDRKLLELEKKHLEAESKRREAEEEEKMRKFEEEL